MLLSQLLLVPLLTIFCWIYIRFRPPHLTSPEVAGFDVIVIATAVISSAYGLFWVSRLDFGDASPIWIPVLSVLTTFHIFPLVLCLGWWLRRRIYPRP